ncbi:hypothetical protein FOA52_000597 [Chlamydomonas sp. UWO 241]|nr:hypothetical protein FOA52_000597 [Chlamydomonas sp. UWO 241]
MEHLPTTLAMLMAENPRAGLPLGQMHSICRQALIALRYLHARGIGHHGLSPSNILFTPGHGSAKLSDFASAGLPGDLATGNARWYHAPEQLVGAPVGCEADVWAPGCILFEMAAGEPLLPGNSDDEQLTLVERVIGVLPARFQLGRSATAAAASACSSSVAVSMHERGGSAADMLCARGVHPDLVDVVAACLEVDPLNRASARDLLLMPLLQGDDRGLGTAASATTLTAAPLTRAKSSRTAAPQLPCAETARAPCVPSARPDSAGGRSATWNGRSASVPRRQRLAEANVHFASLTIGSASVGGGPNLQGNSSSFWQLGSPNSSAVEYGQQLPATQNAPMVPSSTREAGASVLQQALQQVQGQVMVQQVQGQVMVQQEQQQVQLQQQQQQVQQEEQEQPAAHACNEERVGRGRLTRALSSLRGSFKGLLPC